MNSFNSYHFQMASAGKLAGVVGIDAKTRDMAYL
jgi:hypothetical protein